MKMIKTRVFETDNRVFKTDDKIDEVIQPFKKLVMGELNNSQLFIIDNELIAVLWDDKHHARIRADNNMLIFEDYTDQIIKSNRFIKSYKRCGPFIDKIRYTDIKTGINITLSRLNNVSTVLVEQVLAEHGGGDSHEDLPAHRTLIKYYFDEKSCAINETFQPILLMFERDLEKAGSYDVMWERTMKEGWGYTTPKECYERYL